MHPADNPLVSHPQKAGRLRVIWNKLRKVAEPFTESALALVPIRAGRAYEVIASRAVIGAPFEDLVAGLAHAVTEEE